MTCIVGLEDGEDVWIGGDSAGVAGWGLTTRADKKVFRNADFLFGFSTSFRMGQLLRYRLILPKLHSDDDLEKFMATDVVDAIRQCLKEYGINKTENGVDSGGDFLIGFRGKLFRVAADYQVGSSTHAFQAIGCGDDIALGAMFVTANLGTSPKDRLMRALEAAQEFSAGVRAPFHIEKL